MCTMCNLVLFQLLKQPNLERCTPSARSKHCVMSHTPTECVCIWMVREYRMQLLRLVVMPLRFVSKRLEPA